MMQQKFSVSCVLQQAQQYARGMQEIGCLQVVCISQFEKVNQA